ncbi:MAG: hypothetical protein WCG87_12075 [Bacteroidota bacterium]
MEATAMQAPTEAAVIGSTPNPTQEAVQMATAANTTATLLGTKPTVEQIKTMVQQAVDAALASTDFTSDINLVTKALKALAVPDAEARFRKQFRDVAVRNLLKKAPVVNGNVAYPSDAVIDTEVSRLFANWRAKQAKA